MTFTDYLNGRVTLRQIIVYVKHLPLESQTVRLNRGDTAEWNTQTAMLADIIDILNIANWQRAEGRGGQPKRYPRPAID